MMNASTGSHLLSPAGQQSGSMVSTPELQEFVTHHQAATQETQHMHQSSYEHSTGPSSLYGNHDQQQQQASGSQQNQRKPFKTEYKSKFTPFDQYVYNEVTDSFVKHDSSSAASTAHITNSRSNQDLVSSHHQDHAPSSIIQLEVDAFELANGADQQQHQANEPWYKEVVRRNEKANEYRFKSEVGHQSPLFNYNSNQRADSPLCSEGGRQLNSLSVNCNESIVGDNVTTISSSDAKSQHSDQVSATEHGSQQQQQYRFTPHDYKRDNLIAHMANNNNFNLPKETTTGKQPARTHLSSSSARPTTRSAAQVRSRSQSTRRQPMSTTSLQKVNQTATAKSSNNTPVHRATTQRAPLSAPRTVASTANSTTTTRSLSKTSTPTARARPATATANTDSSGSKTAPIKRPTPVGSRLTPKTTTNGTTNTASSRTTPVAAASRKTTPLSSSSSRAPTAATRATTASSRVNSQNVSSTTARKTPTTASRQTPAGRAGAATNGLSSSTSKTTKAPAKSSSSSTQPASSATTEVKSIRSSGAKNSISSTAALAGGAVGLAAAAAVMDPFGSGGAKVDTMNTPDHQSASADSQQSALDQFTAMQPAANPDPFVSEESNNLIFKPSETGNMLADELALAEKNASEAAALKAAVAEVDQQQQLEDEKVPEGEPTGLFENRKDSTSESVIAPTLEDKDIIESAATDDLGSQQQEEVAVQQDIGLKEVSEPTEFGENGLKSFEGGNLSDDKLEQVEERSDSQQEDDGRTFKLVEEEPMEATEAVETIVKSERDLFGNEDTVEDFKPDLIGDTPLDEEISETRKQEDGDNFDSGAINNYYNPPSVSSHLLQDEPALVETVSSNESADEMDEDRESHNDPVTQNDDAHQNDDFSKRSELERVERDLLVEEKNLIDNQIQDQENIAPVNMGDESVKHQQSVEIVGGGEKLGDKPSDEFDAVDLLSDLPVKSQENLDSEVLAVPKEEPFVSEDHKDLFGSESQLERESAGLHASSDSVEHIDVDNEPRQLAEDDTDEPIRETESQQVAAGEKDLLTGLDEDFVAHESSAEDEKLQQPKDTEPIIDTFDPFTTMTLQPAQPSDDQQEDLMIGAAETGIRLADELLQADNDVNAGKPDDQQELQPVVDLMDDIKSDNSPKDENLLGGDLVGSEQTVVAEAAPVDLVADPKQQATDDILRFDDDKTTVVQNDNQVAPNEEALVEVNEKEYTANNNNNDLIETSETSESSDNDQDVALVNGLANGLFSAEDRFDSSDREMYSDMNESGATRELANDLRSEERQDQQEQDLSSGDEPYSIMPTTTTTTSTASMAAATATDGPKKVEGDSFNAELSPKNENEDLLFDSPHLEKTTGTAIISSEKEQKRGEEDTGDELIKENELLANERKDPADTSAELSRSSSSSSSRSSLAEPQVALSTNVTTPTSGQTPGEAATSPMTSDDGDDTQKKHQQQEDKDSRQPTTQEQQQPQIQEILLNVEKLSSIEI